MHTQEVTAYTQSDETAREPELQEYGALKGKILRNTAIIGLVGSSGLALYDTSYASSFALGALASIGYIALLAGSVEQVLLKCVCVRVYMHACMHACMHTCIHTCMHTYIHNGRYRWMRLRTNTNTPATEAEFQGSLSAPPCLPFRTDDACVHVRRRVRTIKHISQDHQTHLSGPSSTSLRTIEYISVFRETQHNTTYKTLKPNKPETLNPSTKLGVS